MYTISVFLHVASVMTYTGCGMVGKFTYLSCMNALGWLKELLEV